MGLDQKSLGVITVAMAIFILVITWTNFNWEMSQDNDCLKTTLTNLNLLFITQASMAVGSILLVCCCGCVEDGYQFCLCVCNCALSTMFIVPIIWMFVDCEVPIMGKNVFHLIVNVTIAVVGGMGLIATKFVHFN